MKRVIWIMLITIVILGINGLMAVYDRKDISTRLDALEAENKVIVQDLKVQVKYLRSLKGLMFCYHPDSTKKNTILTYNDSSMIDELMMGRPDFKINVTVDGVPVTTDSILLIDPDTMVAVERITRYMDSIFVNGKWVYDKRYPTHIIHIPPVELPEKGGGDE